MNTPDMPPFGMRELDEAIGKKKLQINAVDNLLNAYYRLLNPRLRDVARLAGERVLGLVYPVTSRISDAAANLAQVYGLFNGGEAELFADYFMVEANGKLGSKVGDTQSYLAEKERLDTLVNARMQRIRDNNPQRADEVSRHLQLIKNTSISIARNMTRQLPNGQVGFMSLRESLEFIDEQMVLVIQARAANNITQESFTDPL